VRDSDTSKAQPARMYDFLLGGKNHFEPDRRAMSEGLHSLPNARTAVRENRAFLGRAVRYLAAEAGIRQFLDIGAGMPAMSNVHEVAQSVAPDSRVVYVDNDPAVIAHARAELTSHRDGRVAYLLADLNDPDAILRDPAVRETLVFTRPVGLLLVGVLDFLLDEDEPAKAVAALADALPPGSYLVASQTTKDFTDPQVVAEGDAKRESMGLRFQPRSAEELADITLTGLELTPPGLVPVSDWRPQDENAPRPLPAEVAYYGLVARKPAACGGRA
jgi:SAM-dependent methyltransferase